MTSTRGAGKPGQLTYVLDTSVLLAALWCAVLARRSRGPVTALS